MTERDGRIGFTVDDQQRHAPPGQRIRDGVYAKAVQVDVEDGRVHPLGQSLDQFESFEARGDTFRRLVEGLR